MPITFNTNLAALSVRNSSRRTEADLNRALERLSTGQRINKAVDNSIGLLSSSALALDSRLASRGIQNVNDSISLINTASATYSSLSQIVGRQLELAQQSASETLTNSQRASLETENQALQEEYSRLLNSSQFNNINLFQGNNGEINIQGGADFLNLNYRSRATEAAFQGTGSYTNTTHNLTSSGVTASGMILGDLNGDGHDDLTVAYITGSVGGNRVDIYVETYLRDGDTGVFALGDQAHDTIVLTGDLIAFDSIAAEFAEENNLFIQVGYTDTIETSNILYNAKIDGAGDFLKFSSTSTEVNQDQLQSSISSDFNGDGVADLATVGTNLVIGIQVSEEILYESLAQNSISVDSASNAQSALDALKELQEKISRSHSTADSSLSRLEYTVSLLNDLRIEADTAKSKITDADVATEVAELSRLQIMQNTSSAMMAQANQTPELILELFSF